MNFNIVYILVIVFISGVIGLNNTKLSADDGGIIINGKNASDIPAGTTLSPATNSPTTTTPPEPTTPTTTPSSTTTTSTTITTSKTPTTPTTEVPKTTTVIPTPETTTTSTTSVPPTNVTSTTESTTTTTTTAAPAHKGRHFDGPSFIGGIILASGLMAIGFVSWKFYKARTELRNQGHTK